MRNSRAMMLVDPPGRIASGASRSITADATSATVPSPPTAITRRARSAYRSARSLASPAREVIRTSMSTPAGAAARNAAITRRISRRVAGFATTSNRSPSTNRTRLSSGSAFTGNQIETGQEVLPGFVVVVVPAQAMSCHFFVGAKHLLHDVVREPGRGRRQDQSKNAAHGVLHHVA